MNLFQKSITIITSVVFFSGLVSFNYLQEQEGAVESEKVVVITTKFGDLKLKLYNETPIHRDNFLKIVEEDYLDSTLFHRVINQFMIQGGDPDSKGAAPGVELGEGGPDYELDAEFVPGLFHKKGALAAARESDDINPAKKSSGSQFYIVQGRVFDTAQLQSLEQRILQQYRSYEFKLYMAEPENKELFGTYMQAMQSGNRLVSTDIMNKTNPIIDARMEKYKFTEAQVEVYSTVGGTPHLDNNYTVFGELIEGFDVLDSIATVETDENDRPLEDIIMNVTVLEF